MTLAGSYGEPIVTGEAVRVDLRPAGIGSRGVALVVDLGVQVVLTIGVVWLVSAVASAADTATALALLVAGVVVVWVGYPVAFETLWRGRTPGKAALGLRVLRDDGGPVRFRHAFVRGLVGVVVDRPGLSSGLLALVPMLLTARSKRLGDLAAGTVVVQERVPSRLAPPPAMPAGLEQWARGLDLSGVTDAVAYEVRFFLARAPQLAPWARDELGARLLTQLTEAAGPPPPGVPPWAYFTAVLAERRRRELERGASVPLRAADAGAGPPSAPVTPPPLRNGPFAPPG